MRRKIFKKVLSGTMAATMVLGMNITVLAQTGTATGSGSGTGTGSFEGHVDKDVVAVTLPTDSNSTTFAYKMDPEGLIAATNNAKYTDATFEPGANVYFQSTSGNYTWAKDSDKLKVINKGTVDVDVTVAAKTDVNNDVAMSTSKTFTDTTDTAAKLYLGLQVANQAEVAVDTTDAAGKVTVGLKGNSANYEITSVDGGGYGYTAKAGVPDTAWNSFEFGMTGACNPYGDYSANGLAGSNVTVTWSYAVRATDSSATLLDANAVADAAPSIANTTVTFSKANGVTIPVSLGGGDLAATGITSVAVVRNGSVYPMTAGYSLTGTTLTLTTAASIASLAVGEERVVRVTFNDTAKTAVNLTVTIAE